MQAKYPEHFKGRILEVGSRDINGSVRPYFNDARLYAGIDCIEGKGVDYVCLAHEFKCREQFDTIISCECFEHDPYLDQTLANIINLLKPGGLFLATMAGPERQEHGTTRTTSAAGNPDFGPDPDFYENGDVDELRFTLKNYFDPLVIQLVRHDCDLHLYGVRNERLSLNQQCARAKSIAATGDDDNADVRESVQATGTTE